MTLRDLQRAAKQQGAHVENDSAGRTAAFQVVAPYGWVWREGCVESIRVEWNPTDNDERDAAITDALARMRHGIIPA